MNKLQELIEAEVKILSEDKTKDVMNVMVPFIQSDIKNQNGRLVSKARTSLVCIDKNFEPKSIPEDIKQKVT